MDAINFNCSELFNITTKTAFLVKLRDLASQWQKNRPERLLIIF